MYKPLIGWYDGNAGDFLGKILLFSILVIGVHSMYLLLLKVNGFRDSWF